MSPKAIERMVFAFLIAFFSLIAALRIDTIDGALVYQVARSMASGDGFAVPAPQDDRGAHGDWGVDGRFYAPYALGASLSVLPFYLLGEAVYRITGWGTLGYVTRVAVSLRNVLVGALTGCVLLRLVWRLGYPERAAVIAALAGVLATPFILYVKTMFSEPLLTLLLLWAFLAVLQAEQGSRGGWFVAGIALGCASLVKPATLAVVPVFLGYAIWTRSGSARWKAPLEMATPILCGVLITGWYNVVRFGSPVSTGYRGVRFDQPPWIGLYGLLLSPGKGLLWFCPLVIAGAAGLVRLFARRPQHALLIIAVVIPFLGVHSVYREWHGGGGWGPRLILPLIPLLTLPAAEWFGKTDGGRPVQLMLALVLVLSLLVQVPAVLVHWGRAAQAVYDASASQTEYAYRIAYRVADSSLWRQWVSLMEVSSLMRDPQRRLAVIQAARELGREQACLPTSVADNNDELTATVGYLAFNTFDFWWIYWIILGAPWWSVIWVVAILLLVFGWSGWRVFRWLRAGE